MILMSHHQHYDTPADEARVTTTTPPTAPARAAVTPPDGMTLLPSDFNPGKSDVSKVIND